MHASKESVVVDQDDDDQLASLQALLASADAVVWSLGSPVAAHPAFAPQQIRHDHPNLTVTTITPFGLEGEWCHRAATEFTLQAWSGGIVGLARGRPDREPVYVGGQIGEWLAGLFAAIGTLAAGWRGDPGGDLVDVSMLEALASCLTYYPVTFNDQMGRPMRKKRFVPTPGVGAASDGLVGLGVGTGQQWLDFCAMVQHPEWTEDPKLFLDRTALASTIDEWIGRHTVNEVLDLTSAFRIPNAPVVNGANATTFEHFRQPRDLRPEPEGRCGEPASALPARRSPPASRRARPPTRRALHRSGPAAAQGSIQVAKAPTLRRPSLRGPAGVGHDRLLGGTPGGPRAGTPWGGGDPSGVCEQAGRRPVGRRRAPERRAVLGTRTDLRRAQHQQEEPDPRPPQPSGQRSPPGVRQDVRRRHRELHPAGARPARRRLRDVAERTSGSGHGPDAGVRARWSLARPGGVRLRH